MVKVLMFHRVLPEKLITQPNAYLTFGTLISQEYFETVLFTIQSNGFQIVTVSELSNQNKSNKLVALTFDDGYSDNFEFALPSLQKFNATATFFPLVEPCNTNAVLPLDIYYQCIDELSLTEQERVEYIKGETKRKFYWAEPSKQMEMLKELFSQLPNKYRVGYMNAEQIKMLSDFGFEIGSHGMTHSLLTAHYMNEKQIISELENSKRWLAAVTGKSPIAYCFPAGMYNARTIELARLVGYRSTCLVRRQENEKEVIRSYDRIFVNPNSLDELKSALDVK